MEINPVLIKNEASDLQKFDAGDFAEALVDLNPVELAKTWKVNTGQDLKDFPQILKARAAMFAELYGAIAFYNKFVKPINPKFFDKDKLKAMRQSVLDSTASTEKKLAEQKNKAKEFLKKQQSGK